MSDRASLPHVLTERLGTISALDGPAKKAGKAVRSAFGPGAARDLLAGRWLGHSVHPLLTDVVIGTWTSALLLDVVGGDRDGDATERLMAIGLAAYGPTAATGALDWADSEAVDDGVRRIGAVHATGNAVAFALQTASLVARRRGDRSRGRTLSLLAAGTLGVGGYLGAHLSFVRGVGVDQNAFDEGPEDWTPAVRSADVPEREPVGADAAGTPVLVVRDGRGIRAIHDRCSHRGCLLSDGKLDGDLIECACHGSLFRLDDGGVERGPASSPQPAFDARERDGTVEVRRRAGV